MIIQISFITFAGSFCEFQDNSTLKLTLITCYENNYTETGTAGRDRDS